MNTTVSARDYHDPAGFIAQLPSELPWEEMQAKFSFIGSISGQVREQFDRIRQTGEQLWEIAKFQKMSVIGPVVHTISAYIHPDRFRRRGQLIQFCQLDVHKFTSDGKKAGNELLSKAGHGFLKNLAHVAWKASQGSENEVTDFIRGPCRPQALQSTQG